MSDRQSARKALLKAGQTAFARQGYKAASLAGIVAEAKVTTGSLYHHYKDKKALFRAVAEDMERAFLVDVVKRVPPHEDDWNRLLAGLHATLELSVNPALQRILFVDAPTVLGAEDWRAIQMQYGFGLVDTSIKNMLKNGMIRKDIGEMASHMLMGALVEGAQAVAVSDDKQKSLDHAKATLSAFLQSLRA